MVATGLLLYNVKKLVHTKMNILSNTTTTTTTNLFNLIFFI